ncbi:FMN-linked oxidoreductase [Coniochaeta ligniaria NRRL 30616]|uniref:FMN-linked oxidoreductase n=1 Tax=Coniochaeta ligniaria NRRL 30616 TaxID=1408157 RepID=A0A1J7IBT3_9PEZI|nr:FMN-linked oxidoreductase [Coniochaeta ligniaria NRRL 30616]
MPAATSPFAALKDTALFTPLTLGKLALEHRIVQAPLTRMRAEKQGDVNVPGDLLVEYYSQRANKGGLQLTEATDICKTASGYPGVPGVFAESQLAGWKRVTDAVHAKGGSIYVQLWHTGRASGQKMRGGAQPLSSSSIPMQGNYLDGTPCADEPPKPASVEEIQELTQTWAAAAKAAVEQAGFDGVEIHGANGYLLDQFLHDNVNVRDDAYGGSVEKRCRFPLEVIKAVSDAIGADKVGIRLSPFNYFQDTKDSNPNAHWAYLCTQIAGLPNAQRPAYVHMVEPRFDEVLDEEQKMAALAQYTSADGTTAENAPVKKVVNSLTPFRNILKEAGVKFLSAGGFDRDTAAKKIEEGTADAIVMGRYFISNPDLVERLRQGYPLNKYDRTTFYGGDHKGYSDYPFYEQ